MLGDRGSGSVNDIRGEARRYEFWLALTGFLVLAFAVAAIGGAVTANSVDTWYRALNKPTINPPDGVFGPVWTLLYIMMAIAAALAWSGARGAARRAAISWFLVQLALNLSWSALFFGLHQIGLALVCLVLLWLAIAVTARCFWRVRLTAGLLMVPYLIWVAYAGVLNFLIWRLN
jgi:tryptophan-rich sensory protein